MSGTEVSRLGPIPLDLVVFEEHSRSWLNVVLPTFGGVQYTPVNHTTLSLYRHRVQMMLTIIYHAFSWR